MNYLTLDVSGKEYTRPARFIHEFPHNDRLTALLAVTPIIEKRIGVQLAKPIRYGTPLFQSFGFTRNQAKTHREAKLLMLAGADLPLELI